MTVFFSDSFNGSGSLAGTVPAVPLAPGLAWGGSSSNVGLADGYAVVPTPANSNTVALAVYGVDGINTDYGKPAPVRLTFVMRTPPNLANVDGNSHGGVIIEVFCGGLKTSVRVWGYLSGGVITWYANINTTTYVVVTPYLSAATEYTGTLDIADGSQVFTFVGQTLSNTNTFSTTTGLSQINLIVYGYSKVAELRVNSNLDGNGDVAPAILSLLRAGTMLGTPALLAAHDFTGVLGDAITRWVMDLITPSGAVRVPISSWQATLQSGSSSYVQCVVPACLAWVDAINAATEFVIYRRADVPAAALAIEYEMARSPAQQAQFDQGPGRYTCTLSGYAQAFAEDLNPPAVYDRTLAGVRSVSSGSGLRVRCAIDWLLRPGQRAYLGAVPLLVRFINYYALANDAYMDVGE